MTLVGVPVGFPLREVPRLGTDHLRFPANLDDRRCRDNGCVEQVELVLVPLGVAERSDVAVPQGLVADVRDVILRLSTVFDEVNSPLVACVPPRPHSAHHAVRSQDCHDGREANNQTFLTRHNMVNVITGAACQ